MQEMGHFLAYWLPIDWSNGKGNGQPVRHSWCVLVLSSGKCNLHWLQSRVGERLLISVASVWRIRLAVILLILVSPYECLCALLSGSKRLWSAKLNDTQCLGAVNQSVLHLSWKRCSQVILVGKHSYTHRWINYHSRFLFSPRTTLASFPLSLDSMLTQIANHSHLKCPMWCLL